MENQILQLILDKVTSMESDVKDLKQGQTAMQADISGLKQGQAETNARLDGLTHLVHGIHVHQEMDFKLLTDVSEKVDGLADVIQAHEQKLEML